MTFVLPERFAQRPPDVGSLVPHVPEESVAAWLPGPGEQGFVWAHIPFAVDQPLSGRRELLYNDLEEFGEFWKSAGRLRPLFEYLGYEYGEDVDSIHATFPHPTLRNERARALDLPRAHRLSRFAAFHGAVFNRSQQTAALAGGNLLVATEDEEAVHDALNHAIVESLLAPGHMRRLQRRAQRIYGNTDSEGMLADAIEEEFSLSEVGDRAVQAMNGETTLPVNDDLALALNPHWKRAAEYINVVIEGRAEASFADAEYLRRHCLLITAAARQALTAM